MVDFTTIQGALGSIKAASDMVKSVMDTSKEISAPLRSELLSIREALVDAKEQTLAVRTEHEALVEEARKLKTQISNLKEWDREKERYTLSKVGDGVAFALKEDAASGTPPHYLCTKCYNEGRKSILNPQKNNLHRVVLICPTCSSKFNTGYTGLDFGYAE